MHHLPETIPDGLDGVVQVDLLQGTQASDFAPPDLLVEVPHGADQRTHFDALLSRLTGPFPAELHEFFHVNTDTGAWQLGYRAAERLVELDPTRKAMVVRCLVPRTFIDCNRLADAEAQGDLAAKGITGAVQPYVRDPGDLRLVNDLHAAYTDVAEHAYAWICGAGGVAIEPHTYGPRTLDVQAVDEQIITNLRRAHAAEVWERSPIRAEVDFITTDEHGVRKADGAVVTDAIGRLEALGLDVVEGGTYYLHPATMGAIHHARWPGQVLCFEVRRDLLVEGYHPFQQQTVVPEKVEPLAAALAESVLAWLQRRSS